MDSVQNALRQSKPAFAEVYPSQSLRDVEWTATRRQVTTIHFFCRFLILKVVYKYIRIYL